MLKRQGFQLPLLSLLAENAQMPKKKLDQQEIEASKENQRLLCSLFR